MRSFPSALPFPIIYVGPFPSALLFPMIHVDPFPFTFLFTMIYVGSFPSAVLSPHEMFVLCVLSVLASNPVGNILLDICLLLWSAGRREVITYLLLRSPGNEINTQPRSVLRVPWPSVHMPLMIKHSFTFQ